MLYLQFGSKQNLATFCLLTRRKKLKKEKSLMLIKPFKKEIEPIEADSMFDDETDYTGEKQNEEFQNDKNNSFFNNTLTSSNSEESK